MCNLTSAGTARFVPFEYYLETFQRHTKDKWYKLVHYITCSYMNVQQVTFTLHHRLHLHQQELCQDTFSPIDYHTINKQYHRVWWSYVSVQEASCDQNPQTEQNQLQHCGAVKWTIKSKNRKKVLTGFKHICV